MNSPIPSVTLCGFMGCGKSTLGRLLAQELDFAYADTDDMLQDAAGMSISDIFAAGGERLFRDMEHDTVVKAAAMQRTVISTGGGVMTFARNAELLHQNTLVVFIHREFDACYDAISRRKNRPIAGSKTREDLKAMYDARLPLYRRYAGFTVHNCGTPDEAIAPLLSHLRASAR